VAGGGTENESTTLNISSKTSNAIPSRAKKPPNSKKEWCLLTVFQQPARNVGFISPAAGLKIRNRFFTELPHREEAK
jgi:hypothetical protein